MAVLSTEELLEFLHIDDAVGAIPVHLGAGIWGTLAVGLYGDLDVIGTGLSRIEQIGVQLQGIGMYGIWAFGMSFGLLWAVNKIFSLRVTHEEELQGLNLSEHGIPPESNPEAITPTRQGQT